MIEALTVVDNDLTQKWLYRLRLAASTNEARDKLGQLSTLVEYFNKASSNTGLAAINWQEWESELHTPGVVSKIKSKYDAFVKADYAVDAAVSQVGHQSDKFKQLEVANTYNFMLYLVHYAGHLN